MRRSFICYNFICPIICIFHNNCKFQFAGKSCNYFVPITTAGQVRITIEENDNFNNMSGTLDVYALHLQFVPKEPHVEAQSFDTVDMRPSERVDALQLLYEYAVTSVNDMANLQWQYNDLKQTVPISVNNIYWFRYKYATPQQAAVTNWSLVKSWQYDAKKLFLVTFDSKSMQCIIESKLQLSEGMVTLETRPSGWKKWETHSLQANSQNCIFTTPSGAKYFTTGEWKFCHNGECGAQCLAMIHMNAIQCMFTILKWYLVFRCKETLKLQPFMCTTSSRRVANVCCHYAIMLQIKPCIFLTTTGSAARNHYLYHLPKFGSQLFHFNLQMCQ